jgi:hypothetical protein
VTSSGLVGADACFFGRFEGVCFLCGGADTLGRTGESPEIFESFESFETESFESFDSGRRGPVTVSGLAGIDACFPECFVGLWCGSDADFAGRRGE